MTSTNMICCKSIRTIYSLCNVIYKKSAFSATKSCIFKYQAIKIADIRMSQNSQRRLICGSAYRFSSVNPKCWNCSHIQEKSSGFCSKCKYIQPIKEHQSYFDVIGIPQEFSIDVAHLTKIFRGLQSLYHPDKFSQKSMKEQELSRERSSAVNAAYRALLKPLSRAEHLLELAGRALLEEQMTLDQEFLMIIMELNEELEEAKDESAVEELSSKNKKTMDNLLKAADEAFKASDYERARDVVAKLKYYQNIYEKVVEFERSHGIVH